MKRRILFSFAVLLTLFIAGSGIAWTYISRTTAKMDTLILLHQVEILREELIIHVQQVQSQLSRSRVRSGGDVDVLIAHVQEMDTIMNTCVGCHHAPELAQGLLAMHDMADDYRNAISRLVTATANREHIAQLEQRAQSLGQELVAMTQGMAFTANVRLQQKTQETMAMIRDVRGILLATLLSSIALAVVTVALLARGLNERLWNLLIATKRISQGDLKHRVGNPGGGRDEFSDLADSFNLMTEHLQRSQRQLLQSAKLAAIGELATNIAYEVNNPLTGVLGYTGLLLKAEDIPAGRKEHLKTIERETIRAREILKNLLNFSRRKPPRMVQTNIADIVEGSLGIIRGQAAVAGVEVRSECPGGLPQVSVDPDEMKQVLVNLVSNAFFAMPQGGTLTVRCGTRTEDAGLEVVTIGITDTGRGIPEEHLDKIFDPFFSTKPDGERTGLGLSISFMIVQNHGGRIEVDSAVGSGSTFTVVLPAGQAPVLQGPAAKEG